MTLTGGTELLTVDNYLFQGCNSLTEIAIPDPVTVLGYSAFELCTDLFHLKLSAKPQEISGACFIDCKRLPDVDFNDALRTIGTGAFSNTVVTVLLIVATDDDLMTTTLAKLATITTTTTS
jgi:hypothetical protein